MRSKVNKNSPDLIRQELLFKPLPYSRFPSPSLIGISQDPRGAHNQMQQEPKGIYSFSLFGSKQFTKLTSDSLSVQNIKHIVQTIYNQHLVAIHSSYLYTG
ncbi:LOW QUALITY PROTEIN: hypothetical protein PanWU01x14_098470 [Parasponia andersonii]|uniref:Uncharacterized protein n=1 Tax=Parasponia andersonii TaxID=3476 RepID=A0A2P5D423_PARAD|nr:LOW QUALITY PROTEIN: hypothetical protein PanWU01x14_098470 [Parasponia andersonii]